MTAIGREARGGADDPVAVALAGAPRAGHFIVTVYGDVAEARGGALWMGPLIAVCAAQGLTEGLVRTAVSRLVAAGRLVGERHGRRSLYRLTDAAKDEFAAVARRLYAPVDEAKRWAIARLSAPLDDTHLAAGWRQSERFALAPDRPGLPYPAAPVFAAETLGSLEPLRAMVREMWDLDACAAAYGGVLQRFGPVLAQSERGWRPEPGLALALRLRLVHEYRLANLADPLLPAAALPEDWPAQAARRLFATLYARLAAAADEGLSDLSPTDRAAQAAAARTTEARLADLRQVLRE